MEQSEEEEERNHKKNIRIFNYRDYLEDIKITRQFNIFLNI